MLCLNRLADETIVVTPPGCQPVYITVCKVRGKRVMLGVQADKEVEVNRLEVQQNIDKDGRREK